MATASWTGLTAQAARSVVNATRNDAAVHGGARPSIRCSWSLRGVGGAGVFFEGFWSSSSIVFGSEVIQLRSSVCLRAKRKTSGGEGATRVLEDGDEQLDEDMRLGLNEISTEALRAMLSEDDKTVEELREKVEDVEYYLTSLAQLDAAKFMLVVKGLLDHEVVPATYELKGPYKAALDRITSVIEDSGWVLKREGTDLGGVGMVDDELMPPVLNSQY